MKSREIDYKKFRWFFTSGNLLVIGGKSAEQNEETIPLAEKNDIILHTKLPGSPFCIIKTQGNKISEQDLREAATFCACFSQQWKNYKKNIEIHIFSPGQIFKDKRAKTGTFNVIGKVKTITVNLELYLTIQENKLRAVPETAAKEKLILIRPGKINKEKFANILKAKLKEKNLNFSEEEILSAIPSGGFMEI